MQHPRDDHGDDDDPHSMAVRQLIVGIFLIVVGVLITAITYEAAQGRGEVALAIGPVVIGAIAAVRGAIGLVQR